MTDKTMPQEPFSNGWGASLGGAHAGTRGRTAATCLEWALPSVRSIRQQQQAVNGLGYTQALDVDGEWGPKTEAGVKWLQKEIGTGVDGQWRRETERLFAAFRR